METLQRTANRGSISTGGYEIDNSLKFEADNQEELLRTPSSAGNSKTWTVSLWFKRTELDNYQMLHLQRTHTSKEFLFLAATGSLLNSVCNHS